MGLLRTHGYGPHNSDSPTAITTVFHGWLHFPQVFNVMDKKKTSYFHDNLYEVKEIEMLNNHKSWSET